MKKFILTFRHLIVLIWLILILLIFKITNNFVFKNGSSILFIILLISLPIFVYIYTSINVRKTRNHIQKVKEGYFQIIKSEINKEKFKLEFLDKIITMKLTYNIIFNESQIEIKLYNNGINNINIYFSNNKCTLIINNTLIKYNYYYNSHLDEFTKYDLRNFEYKETNILYLKILNRIEQLINKEYIYFQSKKELVLSNKETNEIIYQINLNKKINKDIKKMKEEIII